MRRVTVVLVLLALALAVPVAVLVLRALDSAAVEEENRHRLIAERAFDEMESTLSRFLAEEESRPFDAYRFYPSGEPPIRSPLAAPPTLPFVIGYFQIDPDGSFHTPRLPRDLPAAIARGDFRPAPETTELPKRLADAWFAAARLRGARKEKSERAGAADLGERAGELVEREHPGPRALAFEDALSETASPSEPADEEKKSADSGSGFAQQREGATLLDEARDVASLEPPAETQPESDADRSDAPDSFDLYRSFNLAAKRRQEQRQQKVESVPRRALAPSAPPSLAPPAPAPVAPPAFGSAAEQAVGPEAAGRASVGDADTVHAQAPSAAGLAEDRAVQVAVEPMNGRAAPGERLVLYRTVVAGEQGYRQGLVLDWRKLGEWLETEVIEPSGLGGAGASTLFFARGDAPSPSDAAFVYRHPFAEPFDAFGAELRLPVLPGGRGTGTIHALAGLLLLVTVAGLFAVHRMVRVVLQFAERRSRFAASVSHELKTPLTSIRMYGEMLRDGLVPTDAKRAEYYHTITDESERLSRLIDNVLDFSRLERGEYEIRASSGNVGDVVAQAVAKLRPHADRAGFSIRLELPESLPEVVFDEDAVTQIVFNLVDNALKYARDAVQKEIVVRCRAAAAGVTLSVRDFGPGVPGGELPRIFEAFYRREDDETRATRGTGIGLALVRELAASMSGRVEAENADGGGLCVTVSLRARPASGLDPHAPSS